MPADNNNSPALELKEQRSLQPKPLKLNLRAVTTPWLSWRASFKTFPPVQSCRPPFRQHSPQTVHDIRQSTIGKSLRMDIIFLCRVPGKRNYCFFKPLRICCPISRRMRSSSHRSCSRSPCNIFSMLPSFTWR